MTMDSSASTRSPTPTWSFSAAANGATTSSPSSAALLLDPKAMKKQMAQGTALSSHFPSHMISSRATAVELPPIQTSLSEPMPHTTTAIDLLPIHADPDTMDEGKKMARATPPTQAPSKSFDPRRLLDPKGFDRNSKRAEDVNSPAESSATPPLSVLPPHQYTNGHAHPEIEFSTAKIDQDDYEGQGMGNLIEKAYNVGHREERPQKRQRIADTEDFKDDEQKLKFKGGGAKGGDLGQYVKKKKQEGMEESGPVPDMVVDLTQGCYSQNCYLVADH